MRDIPTVISKMLVHIPKTEVAFISDLKSIMSSAMYSPPESQRMWWGEFNETFNIHMPASEELNDWQSAIVKIFMDQA